MSVSEVGKKVFSWPVVNLTFYFFEWGLLCSCCKTHSCSPEAGASCGSWPVALHPSWPSRRVLSQLGTTCRPPRRPPLSCQPTAVPAGRAVSSPGAIAALVCCSAALTYTVGRPALPAPEPTSPHSTLPAVCTLCDPVGCSPPGPSVLGILQASILEWVARPSSSRGSSQSRDQTWVSCIAGRLFTVWATTEAPQLL